MAAKKKRDGPPRPPGARDKSLRAAVERQFSAAAERVVRLLQERPSRDERQLRRMVMGAVSAAVERIFSEYRAAGAAAESEPSTLSHDLPSGSPTYDGPGDNDGPRDGNGELHLCRVSNGTSSLLAKRMDRDAQEAEPAARGQPKLGTEGKLEPATRGKPSSRTEHNPQTQKTLSTDKHVATAPTGLRQDRIDDTKALEPGDRSHQEGDCRLGGHLHEQIQDGVRHRFEEFVQEYSDERGPECVRTLRKAEGSSGGLPDAGLSQSGGAERIQEIPKEHTEDRVPGCGSKRLRSFRERRVPKSALPALSCGQCGKNFTRKSALDRHARAHVGDRPFICEFCGKTFTDKAVLKRHLKRHTGGRPRVHGCDECGKKFIMSQHLLVHKRIHNDERPYACRVCGKTFRQAGNLAAHAKIHTGEKAFVCGLCGKRFRQKISLETHERFHRKDKVFECHVCGRSFVQKVDLKRHMLTHSGEKPHACRMCDKRYQEKRSLEAHMKVHAATDARQCLLQL
ncbi:zinc finger protein 260-like isoform X1 [Syngnathus acus]|uniref:zinc finger protein 260-like isoform X1 n=1 Tax=Syngnathus acus TaxID=161584 RepID=UPI001886149D|nr:zinc finger protein 260-like isoform X1 [Syngnathus acus]